METFGNKIFWCYRTLLTLVVNYIGPSLLKPFSAPLGKELVRITLQARLSSGLWTYQWGDMYQNSRGFISTSTLEQVSWQNEQLIRMKTGFKTQHKMKANITWWHLTNSWHHQYPPVFAEVRNILFNERRNLMPVGKVVFKQKVRRAAAANCSSLYKKYYCDLFWNTVAANKKFLENWNCWMKGSPSENFDLSLAQR